MMRVLAVTSELFPLVKTGGLADVAGALPLALKSHGVEVRTLLPGYPAAIQGLGQTTVVHDYGDARVLAGEVDGVKVLLLDAPQLFDRPGNPYSDAAGADWPDNWKRFAALSRCGSDIAAGLLADWQPDLVHVHDWQAGLTLAYLRHGPRPAVPAIITVHNLSFQGQFPASIFPELGLPSSAFSMEGVEYYGTVGYLKAGLRYASAITTVSPSYAQEIRTPAFGMGMEGLINTRANVLYGIVNGIDTELWDPGSDLDLESTYSSRTIPRRLKNRQALERRFGISHSDGPLFCVISRLTFQKGIDVVAAVADDIVAGGGKLIVLGSGERAQETGILAIAARHPGRVATIIGFDEPLSHLMQGGSDVILIPSRFEPCGLTQLYALRYGCIPVVTRTGGLADTVIDANEAALSAGVATGFQFGPLSAPALRQTLARVFDLWHHPKEWAAMQRQAMKSDVSWHRSASRYFALYRSLVSG
jgi:starch synthase